jgi:exodeoxyribonuclease III
MASHAPSLRITTWNVNSVRQRLDHLIDFLNSEKPDVLCLQEIKCQTDVFPREAIEALGYHAYVHGQKTFNGVALISRKPLEDVMWTLEGDENDAQARFIEGVLMHQGRVVRVASLYLPNGNPVGTEKYPYKLGWMERLHAHAKQRLTFEEAYILAGDYNIIPTAQDAARPEKWKGDALFLPQSRAHFQALLNLGYTDAVRACSQETGLYTFWDYTSGAWPKDEGIRIDHLLTSPQATDALTGFEIHKDYRGREKPSDHVPVSIQLTF